MDLRIGLSLTTPRGTRPRVELVSNGTFNANTTGWTQSAQATVTWDPAGRMVVTNTAAAAGYGFQSLATEPGLTYTLTFTFSDYVGTTQGRISVNNGGATYSGGLLAQNLAAGTYTRTFTATGTTTALAFFVNSTTAGHAIQVDNVSVL